MVNVTNCYRLMAYFYVVLSATEVSILVKNALASLRIPCRAKGLISVTVGDAGLV